MPYTGSLSLLAVLTALLTSPTSATAAQQLQQDRYNALFIISDDLTYTALSCYGNEVCQTPNINRLDESSGVPLIISVPGKQPAVCQSFIELLDLYPTVAVRA